MTLTSLVIRAAACGIVIVGGALFVAQDRQAEPVAPAESDLRSVDFATVSSPNAPPWPAAVEVSASPQVTLPQPIAPVQMSVPTPLVHLTALGEPIVEPSGPQVAHSRFGLVCDISVTATAMPIATVALDVLAPCLPHAPVTITHAGVVLEAETDAFGLLTLDIPGFDSPASLVVSVGDDREDVLRVDLPDLGDYDRIALNWQNNLGLQLNAQQGDQILPNASATQDTASAVERGHFHDLTTSRGSALQVYTLSQGAPESGSVRFSIDAPVTDANCAQTAVARTIRAEAGSPLNVLELSFQVPGCDAVGDVLVLPNIVGGLRLASN